MLYHYKILSLSLLGEYPAIVERHNLNELLSIFIPITENLLSLFAKSQLRVPLDESQDAGFFFGVIDRLQIDHLQIAPLSKIAFLVEDIGNAAAHSGCKVSSSRA